MHLSWQKQQILFSFFCGVGILASSSSQEVLAQPFEKADFGKNPHGLVRSLEDELRTPRPKPVIFRGYGKYRESFGALCAKIDQDGRRDKIYEILSSATGKDEACVACSPLIKMFAASCKPARQTKKAPEPGKKKYKQRDPHVQVLEGITKISSAMADEKDIFMESKKAISKLTALLRNPENKSEGEKDYFSVLADYFQAPFDAAFELMAKEGKVSSEQAPSVKTPEVNLEELF